MNSKAAENILRSIEEFYQEKHEYQQTDLSQFPRLDKNFYQSLTEQFDRHGFTCLGDLEDLTISKRNVSFRTCIRTFVGDQGSIQGAIYHVKPAGFMWVLQVIGLIPRNLKSIDLETEFENKQFIVTTNSKSGQQLTQPPQVDSQFYPAATLDQLLLSHRTRIEKFRTLNPDTNTVLVKSLTELNQSQDRLNLLKAVYRKSVGMLTKEELESLGGYIEDESLIRHIDSQSNNSGGTTNR